MGNLRSKNTFVPNQDKNKRFDERTLGQIRSLNSIPEYSFSDIVQRSSTIDVIWFNQRNMPDSFFEVEHSTDIQNSLLKFEDLIDFSARMFIVADLVRKEEVQKKMNYDVFKILKENKRVIEIKPDTKKVNEKEFEKYKKDLMEQLEILHFIICKQLVLKIL